MNDRQFRTLYRQFLFRMVDLELLAPQGDMTRLLGQFAGLLVFFSACLALAAVLSDGLRLPAPLRLIATWSLENFLIATTMLVVGLFAVLSWDSTFPDRRDVLVLAPLPVRTRTIFLAKVAAAGSALALTILALHLVAGLVWPLMLARQPVALPAPDVEYNAAIAPVGIDHLKEVLDLDLAPALRNGALAPSTHAGMVVGAIQGRDRRVWSYGIARTDSIYEIGSISKTFTALILARMIDEGRVRLDEPVRELLPPETVAKPKTAEITLLDLATHHSGLPGMPNNMSEDNLADAFANYRNEQMFAYLRRRGVWRPEEPEFAYSNLGFGVLGQALAARAGISYDALLRSEVLAPLQLRDTGISLSREQQQRLIPAFDMKSQPAAPWDLDALAPAGAIRSTADDLLTYLNANLHPESAPPLQRALLLSHLDRAEVAEDTKIALAWIHNNDMYWHNGAISGYRSYAWFDPRHDSAAVVLLNNSALGFSGMMALHVYQRMTGRPAISLASTTVPAGGGFFGILRSFAAYWITMIAAGAFVFCGVLGLQGLAAQLPRRIFLRVSSFLQMIAFCVFVCTYFLQPLMVAPTALSARQLELLPSYWFLGVFEQLNGSPALSGLARRAWTGFAATIAATLFAYTLTYVRSIRKIAEEPDIVASRAGLRWAPRFGGRLATAVVRFSYRTLLRSRQHRVMLAFYAGVGLAVLVFLRKHPSPYSSPMLFSTLAIMGVWVTGVRVVFSIPLALRANWIFRVTEILPAARYRAAARRALFVLGVAPVWIVSAAALLWRWPWPMAIEHLGVLALWGMLLAYLLLGGFRKIPFTCSYLPGKTYVHMAMLAFAGFLVVLGEGVRYEIAALTGSASYTMLAMPLAITMLAARWRACAPVEEAIVQFEDADPPAVLELGLHRDGVVP